MMNTNMLLQVLLILLAVATFLGSTECKVIITEVGANSDINVRRRRIFFYSARRLNFGVPTFIFNCVVVCFIYS